MIFAHGQVALLEHTFKEALLLFGLGNVGAGWRAVLRSSSSQGYEARESDNAEILHFDGWKIVS